MGGRTCYAKRDSELVSISSKKVIVGERTGSSMGRETGLVPVVWEKGKIHQQAFCPNYFLDQANGQSLLGVSRDV